MLGKIVPNSVCTIVYGRLFQILYCSAITAASGTLQDIHEKLCHPGVTRLLHFIWNRNLPFSTTDVKRVVFACDIFARVFLLVTFMTFLPLFVRKNQGTLVKALRPMERISIDFKRAITIIYS